MIKKTILVTLVIGLALSGMADATAYHEQLPYTPVSWGTGVTPYGSFDGAILTNGVFGMAGYTYTGTLYIGETGWFVVTGDGQVPMAGPGYGPLPATLEVL